MRRERSRELDSLNDELTRQMKILRRCTLSVPGYGRLLLATPPKNRYPYIYPRDCSSAVALLRRVACSQNDYDVRREAFELIRSMARFLRDVGREPGCWGQRYSPQGESKSIYRQEDNLAHGMAVLCNYLLTVRALGEEEPELEDFLHCINRAAACALEDFYETELNLFRSTTAIHESALEQGYTCWVNFSFLYAFSLAHEVAQLLDEKGIIESRHLEFRKNFLHSVNELFLYGNRYARRITAEGHLDLRPDITLLSPFYYGFLHNWRELENSVVFLEKHLWDPQLGMVMRYLPFRDDFSTHVHAGNGPWLQYTAVLAQFHFWRGNRQRGDELLQRIQSFANEEGELPEHISTCQRFENFLQEEWETGIDFAKEFHKPILLEGLEFTKILEEANNMARSYQETARRCMRMDESQPGGGYILFAVPLMWSHVEYMRALLIRAGDWWKLKKPPAGEA